MAIKEIEWNKKNKDILKFIMVLFVLILMCVVPLLTDFHNKVNHKIDTGTDNSKKVILIDEGGGRANSLFRRKIERVKYLFNKNR